MELYVDADVEKVYDLTQVDFPLGAKVKDQSGRYYVFCKYNEGDGAVDGAAGMIVVGLDDDELEFEVTADVNSATIKALGSDVKGIIVPTEVVDGEGFFAQFAGRNVAAMITDGGVANGQHLKAHATTDGGVDTYAGTEAFTPFAIALADDSGTELAVGDCRLYCPTVR